MTQTHTSSKTKQHGPSSSYKEGKRRLDKVISQDIEEIGDNDRCTENGEGYLKSW